MLMINIIQIGMGPLGIKMAQYIAARKGFNTVAAVDLNPQLIGKSLQHLSDELSPKIHIEQNINEALSIASVQPQVALLTTVSDMQRITPQSEAILQAGIPVDSTCEELS